MEYEINPEETRTKLAAGEIKLLDVRETFEVQTAGIDGSLHIPMGELAARCHTELDPEEHIVVMCHHGVRSLNATAWLRAQGFEKVQSMAGGIHRWSQEIDPKVPTY